MNIHLTVIMYNIEMYIIHVHACMYILHATLLSVSDDLNDLKSELNEKLTQTYSIVIDDFFFE